MSKQPALILGAVGLLLTTLACQSLGNFNVVAATTPTPTPIAWPYSTFVPPYRASQVRVGQPLEIKTHHVSDTQLQTIEVFINGQPPTTEETAAQSNAFPRGRVNLQLRTPAGQLLPLSQVTPALPTKTMDVSLVWVGNIPGQYDLSLVATDANGRGQPITQRIEVRDPASER